MRAASKGRWFNAHIRDQFPFSERLQKGGLFS
jgi:hypothetical protein